jgi:hypothetical protein
MKNEKPSTDGGKSDGKWDVPGFIIVILILCGSWLLSWHLIDKNIVSPNPALVTDEEIRGAFGSKFGAISSLFSCIAFVGIIFTMLLQKRDLRYQQKTILDQSRLMAIQSFETGFFNLLDQHKSNIDQLAIGSFERREAFSYFNDLMKINSNEFSIFNLLKLIPKHEIIEMKTTRVIPTESRPRFEEQDQEALTECLASKIQILDFYLDETISLHYEYIKEAYLKANYRTKGVLSHYFRTLYVIIKYIDDSTSIQTEEKQNYARILRAQLSDEELLALFYNVVMRPIPGDNPLEFGFPKMTQYVKKYDLLQNMNKSKLYHPIHLRILNNAQEEASK